MNYGTAEGYASAESNSAGFFLDTDGSIWFGTAEGLSRHRPDQAVDLTRAPRVEISRMDFDGARIEPGANLPWQKGTVRARVAALTFVDRRKVEAQYRVLGYDEQWRAMDLGTLDIRNLPPGDFAWKCAPASTEVPGRARRVSNGACSRRGGERRGS